MERRNNMNRINSQTTADLFFQFNWSENGVQHTDAFAGHQVNFWRDIIPQRLVEGLMEKKTGDLVRMSISVDELLGVPSTNGVHTIDHRQFDSSRISRTSYRPRTGRFYPKGILADVTGVFKANTEPFRCIDVANGQLGIAMGHPMAGKTIDLNVTVGSIRSKLEERGGSLRKWGEIIARGPGMQARWENQPTDFFSDHPFERKDELPDSAFYARPRLVQHIDDTAIDMVRQIYSRFILNDMKILDLMSSWQSHLPETNSSHHVTGLGLNKEELQNNKALQEYHVHDLNADSQIPYDDDTFDLILCSLSVEYLINPFRVFKEAARILKPGGYLMISFSNRWFEPKSIKIWRELHEFERMGLVLEFFKRDDLFSDLHTYSVRGLSRPPHDKYYGKIPYSDPVFVVWAMSK
jgi:FKBP-type peptidyl-prolyl cis-trans isomerase 2